MCHCQTSEYAAAEIDVKRKLSEGQCSGSVFSDTSVDEAARTEAVDRQLTVIKLQRPSGQVFCSFYFKL